MFNDTFYPTPKELGVGLIDNIKWHEVKNILEPSAGKGNLCELILEQVNLDKTIYKYKNRNIELDCFEINEELKATLKGKGFRVIGSNFLEYNGFKKYDLIVMNPPFIDGDKHLLKAIDCCDDNGEIRCILNAETIKNPYTNTRKELLNKLEQLNANIDFVENAFSNAERKTNVEIAIIKLKNKKISQDYSYILEKMKEDKIEIENKFALSKTSSSIDTKDFLVEIVKRYELEVKCAFNFIHEYEALCDNSLVNTSFNENSSCLIDIYIDNQKQYSHNIKNNLLSKIRKKYWYTLFNSNELTQLMTIKIKENFISRLSDLKNYPFTVENINIIMNELTFSFKDNIEKAIIDMFDKFSYLCYYDEFSNNIHYFNGWKTNKAYIVNKKVIQRLNAYNTIYNEYFPTDYHIIEYLEEIEKTFNYLDDNSTQFDKSIKEICLTAKENNITKNIEFKYFWITFYKKGTTHIVFKDDNLLKKFNLIGCMKKGWLFNDYGKKSYSNMTGEEKQLVDEFEGEKSYTDTFQNNKYYLNINTINTNLLLN